jgi:MraZ protein
VIIPAAFREDGLSKLMLTKATEDCLFIFSMEQWQKMCAELDELQESDDDAQDFRRWFYSSAALCELDKNARILVPPELRIYANLEKDITIIGVGSRAEVWNKSTWENYSRKESFDRKSLKDTMKKLFL